MTTLTARGAASISATADELIGPLSGAVQPQVLPWGATASFAVPPGSRHPVVLVRLLRSLGAETLSVVVTVDGNALPPLTFAPWTEVGTQLVAYAAPVDPGGTAAGFTGLVKARLLSGASTTLNIGQTTAIVGLDLVQGLLGKVVCVLVSDKAQQRRQASELAAMRKLLVARDDALDRIGADLGVPRLRDALSWDATTQRLGATPLAGGREPDESYRARLRMLRGMRLPTPAWVDAALNGVVGPDAAPGWLADVGLTAHVDVDETANPFFVGFRLVAPGQAAARAELLAAIRQTHLVWPAGSVAGDAAHAARMLPPAISDRVGQARQALATMGLPANEPVAPALAFALQQLDALQTRLGARPYPTLAAGQQDDGGSRFELGFGAQLAAPTSADLTAAVTAAQALADPGVIAVGVADDPLGDWLLSACGLRTSQQLSDGSVYVSTMSSGSLVVDVAPRPDGALPLILTAELQGVETDLDAPLQGIVTALQAESLTPTDPATMLAGLQPSGAVADVDGLLATLGLPRVVQVADVVSRLQSVSSRSYVAFDLGATETANVVTDPTQLASIIGQAARGGASSVLPVVTSSGTLGLVFGVVDLPLAGNNLAAQHTVAYRWLARSLVGDAPTLSTRRGASTTITAADRGISLVTCIAYVRTGANDPYQWTPSLPEGALLTLQQYEHLMNAVELVTPLGVQADTWAIRRQHVDVDGSGVPTPLSPSAARTYHRYRPAHA